MERVVQGLAVLTLAWAAAVTAQAAAPHYRVQMLPEQPGVTEVYLFDINNEGLAVGTRYLRSEGRSEGFTYRDGVTQLLPTPGARSSNAWGLNERGDVIGSMDISDTASRAFIYRGGRFIDVLPPPNNEEGTNGLVDINNLGHVVAVGRDASVHHASPFIFDGTKSYFLTIPEEFHVEDPSALSDRDEVVGTTVHHRAYYYHDGQTLLLPQPGDQFPTPFYSMSGVDINNQGQILVNYAYDRLNSYIYQDGEYTRLPHERFVGVDINEHGWVLGWAGLHARRPKLFMDGSFYDLNSRILRGEDKDWRMLEVYAMNDLGQIIGRGSNGAFIATPIPEPRSSWLMFTGLLAVGAWIRRRPTARA